MLKAAAESTVSLKSTPNESDSIHCPFKTRHGVPIFQYYAQNPDKAGRFARAMAGYRRSRLRHQVQCIPSHTNWIDFSQWKVVSTN